MSEQQNSPGTRIQPALDGAGTATGPRHIHSPTTGKTAVVQGWFARARAAGFAVEIRDSRCSLPRQ